uniref:DNA adenine methylase n=1 Tax=Brachybacterium sp. GPGPB12 TaxID=3023517 RepID=UPI00404B41F4
MRYLSPLRYPGGKARLAPYLARLITAQDPEPRQYAEPFAGGAGAALHLLHDGVVDRIHLNDLNPGIASILAGLIRFPEPVLPGDSVRSFNYRRMASAG